MPKTSRFLKTFLRSIILLWLLGFSLNSSIHANAGTNTWTSIGPEGAPITALAVNPADTDLVFAATEDAGIFKSTDGGLHWAAANTGLSNKTITSLAIDPVDPSILYAGAWNGSYGSVFKSTDTGASWSWSASGIGSYGVYGIVVDTAAHTTLYAASWNGVYKSTDSGATWTSSSSGISSINLHAIAINPASPNILYVGTHSAGVFKSIDAGASWSPANLSIETLFVSTIAVDPLTPTTVYVGAGSIYRSTDSGATWTNVTGASIGASRLVVAPTVPAMVYAGTGSGIYSSSGGAGPWTAINSGLVGAPAVQALAISPADSNTLYAGSYLVDASLYKTTNAGGLWTKINSGLVGSYAHAMVIEPVSGTLFVGMYDRMRGIYKSPDHGASWTVSGFPNDQISDLALAQTTPATVWATTGSGLQKSIDLGATWSPVTSPGATLIAVPPNDPEVIYIGNNAGVSRSINAGSTWTTSASGLIVNYITTLAVDPVISTTVYVSYQNSGLFKSVDAGANWTLITSGLPTSAPASYIMAIAIDPVSPNIVYVGTWGGGVYKSIDGGITWVSTGSGLGYPVVFSLAVDPANHTQIYAGTWGGGVYRSLDSGLHWQSLNTGLTNLSIYDLLIEPGSPAVLYAGTRAGGAFALEIPVPNPMPAISSLSPDTTPAGVAAFNLTVYGTDFVETAVIRWDNIDLATTYLDAYTLQASVSAGKVSTPGSHMVTVFNPAPGGGESGGAVFNVSAASTATPFPTPTPAPPLAGKPVYQQVVDAGAFFVCAVTPSGGVVCWGDNNGGQLGRGTPGAASSLPQSVAGIGAPASAVAAGIETACALTENGAVRCWGRGDYGQLGNGTDSTSYSPVTVAGLTGVRQISAGDHFFCALLETGGVKCWGLGTSGQLGNGISSSSNLPVDVNGLTSGVSFIALGGHHACALLANGQVKCWGTNDWGQSGNPDHTAHSSPVLVAGLSGVREIAAGSAHTCAVLADGAVKCWGYNQGGQLGDGFQNDRDFPAFVLGLADQAVAVAAGSSHTCALLVNGSIQCWGAGFAGQLGTGSFAGSNYP